MYGAVSRLTPWGEPEDDDEALDRLLSDGDDAPSPAAATVRTRASSRGWTALLVGVTALLVFVAFINPKPSPRIHTRRSNREVKSENRRAALFRLSSGTPAAHSRASGRASTSTKSTYGDLSDEDQQDLFTTFKKDYDRDYDSDEEEAHRFEIFKGNLEKIDALNVASKTAVYDITRWADMTKEEYSTSLGLRLPGSTATSAVISSKRITTRSSKTASDPEDEGDDPTYLGGWDGETCYSCDRFPELSSYSADSLPDSFDWRDYGAVTQVKDQGGCGSCWSFSATGDMEGSSFLSGNDLEDLSEQQILACDMTDFVCDGGYPASAFRYIISTGGSVSEYTCSYNFTQLTFDTLGGDYCRAFHDEIVATFTGWYEVSHSGAQETMLQLALIKLGPLSVAINAESMEFYSSGIDDPTVRTCPGSYDDLDHAVLLVGYGVEEGVEFWLVKNSWSEAWGEGGYWRVIRGVNACGIAMQVDHSVVT